MTSPRRYEDRTVVITGAGSGIGRACAIRFAAEGAHVVVADIDLQAAEATVAALQDAGGKGRAVHTDVSEPRQLEELRDVAVSDTGRLHVWINNAFRSVFKPITEQTLDEFDDTIRISLRAYWYGSKLAATHMLDHGGGVILQVASVQSYFGEPGFSAYQCAKGGILSLARSVGIDAAPNVRSVALAPGFIHTPAHDGIPAETIARVTASIPAQRGAQPEEVAALAAYAASDEAGYLTATGIILDGGYLAV